MDMIREQRVVIEGLRGDLKAALREVKHQAELVAALMTWMIRNGHGQEVADIVGVEASVAIMNAIAKNDAAKLYD